MSLLDRFIEALFGRKRRVSSQRMGSKPVDRPTGAVYGLPDDGERNDGNPHYGFDLGQGSALSEAELKRLKEETE